MPGGCAARPACTRTRRPVRVRFATPEAFRSYFKSHYGPTIAAYRGIAEDAERITELDRGLTDLARRHDRGTGTTVLDWEYLLLTARKRA